MADSKDKNNDSSDNFADDLDAMLNDEKSSNDDNSELIDDEDAIDRLLMDDAFDAVEDDIPSADAVDKALEDSHNMETETDNATQDEGDEFSEDEQTDSIIERTVTENNTEQQSIEEDEFNVDDLIDSVAEEEQGQEEVGVFSEDGLETEDDFLMADFDISADDDLSDDADNILDEFAEDEGLSAATNIDENAENEADDEQIALEDEPVAEVEPEVESEPELTSTYLPPAEDLEIQSLFANNKEAIDEANNKIDQLQIDTGSVKQQLDEQIAGINSSVAEELESLQKDQRKLKKAIRESEAKVPVMVYVALGVAIVALLVGGGLGIIGYSAQTDVEELSELVMTLEEEIEIITAKDTTKDVKQLKETIELLTAKNGMLNQQVDDLGQLIEKPNPLKPVVDDLVKQNDHAQEAIEQLLAKVEVLEQRKIVTPVRKKPKKVVVKVKWVVNLVSFKQEWYAKRKAGEFDKKGVSTDVIPVKVNGENWFRLRVVGFKSKYEAAAYAVKVKKLLNLSSVWVTKE